MYSYEHYSHSFSQDSSAYSVCMYVYVFMYGNYQPSTGSFAGFDLNEPTSRDGGKPAVINQVCMYTIVGIIVVHDLKLFYLWFWYVFYLTAI